MITFPGCKINIGLSVVEKRSDGYHNIETIFYPIKLEDILEIVPSQDGTTQMHLSGIALSCNHSENLVFKAYHLLQERFNLPPLYFYLHKRIPFGAGLGGGSSDAASAIKILNTMFALQMSQQEMRDVANHIGADCPFFIENRPLFATGTGNIMHPVLLTLHNYKIIIVKPPYFLDTKMMYNNIIPQKPKFILTESIKQHVSEWKHIIFNDFEKIAFEQYPAIRQIKNTLYNHGALYAAMSGSGSAVFGIFENVPSFHFPNEYQVFISS